MSLLYTTDIWSQNAKHYEIAEWVNEVKEDVSERRKQEGITIDAVMLRKQLGKHAGQTRSMDFGYLWEDNNTFEYLKIGNTPEWMAQGRTCWILKDKKKGNETSNFRQIMFLPIMCKVFIGILAEQFKDIW